MNLKNRWMGMAVVVCALAGFGIWRGGTLVWAQEDAAEIEPGSVPKMELSTATRCQVVLRPDRLMTPTTAIGGVGREITGQLIEIGPKWIILEAPEMMRQQDRDQDRTYATGSEFRYWIPVENVLYYRIWKK